MPKITAHYTEAPTSPPKSPYPYIGVWENLIVLFSGPNTGVFLGSTSDSASVTGIPEVNWSERHYKPLNGSITLTQTI